MAVPKKKSKNPRMCLVCRRHDVPANFIRVVRRPDGTVVVDDSGRVNGRGAYLCPSSRCVQTAFRQKRLDKALKVRVPEDVYLRLLERVRGLADGDDA